MTPELLSEEESADLYGVSVRKFAELRDEKWMPLPVVLGPRLLRWSRAELLAAIEGMPRAARERFEPEQLKRVRAERVARAAVQ